MQSLKCSLFHNSSPFLNLHFSSSLKNPLKMSLIYSNTFHIPALIHMATHLHECVWEMLYLEMS